MERLDLPAIRGLLRTERFGSWFAEFSGLQARRRMVQEELDDLRLQRRRAQFESQYWREFSDDSLLKSTDLRTKIDSLQADAVRAENEAYRLLVRFENKRVEVTELWERIGVLELKVDEYGDEATRNRVRRKIAPQLNKLRAAYTKGSEEKEAIWVEHEQLWLRSSEAALTVPEASKQAERLERRYGDLSNRANEHQINANALAEQVEELSEDLQAIDDALKRLKSAATEHFDCLCHEEFLYWVAGDDRDRVYLVPLINNSEDYNIEVYARQLYQCAAESGVSHLEPVSSESDTGQDMERLREIFEGLVEAL